jgi:hypothetical protein
LIAQNLTASQKAEMFRPVSTPANDSKNFYQNLIRSSPTKTRDDYTLSLKNNPINNTQVNLPEKYTIPGLNVFSTATDRNPISKVKLFVTN